MVERSDDQRSRLQDYQERLEKLMETAREEVGRQAPEVLDKLAATAKNIGQRLDEMAGEARRTRAEKEATTSAPGPKPPAPAGEAPSPSGEPTAPPAEPLAPPGEAPPPGESGPTGA